MNDIPFWLQLFIYQLPTLIVATVGVILSLVNMRRASGASLLALLGCGLLIVGGLASLGIRVLLWQQMREGEMPHERFAQLSSLVGIASSLTYALALGLIVLAVFAGRGAKPTAKAGPDF
jgi:hypothetical protein